MDKTAKWYSEAPALTKKFYDFMAVAPGPMSITECRSGLKLCVGGKEPFVAAYAYQCDDDIEKMLAKGIENISGGVDANGRAI